MSKKIILTADAPAPIGPYSQAVKKGNMLFVSGQIAINPDSGELIVGNITAETQMVMQNLKAVLAAAEMDFSHIVKTTIFIKNMDDFSAINAIYGSFFTADFPARETVEVARLPKDVNVEISCVAVM